jgi:D-beta-D-heptose 7-phosphate kinase/D-beta-D-heptose 1-phosphate adenosyltransferase
MDIDVVVSRFVGKKIVVIGDVMVDEYIQGSVQRISPEMPVPLLLRTRLPSIDEDLIRLGGAGNTARNLASLGAEVMLIGVSGKKDPASRQLRALIRHHAPKRKSPASRRFRIDCRIIPQDDLLTTHKLRLLNNQSIQLFRIDTEAPQELRGTTIDAVLNEFRSAVAWCDVVVVTDYAKGLITKNVFQKLRAICDRKPIIVDPKELKSGLKFTKYEGADVIIPNESELRKSFDYQFSGDPLESLFAGELQRSLSHIDVKAIICTRGAKGILYSDCSTDSAASVVGRNVEVADITGASDTVTATVALSWAQDAELEIASKIAEAAGRIKVTKRLTGTVYIGELLEALDPMFKKRAWAKLHLDQSAFLSAILDLKKRGGPSTRTAFVTGCFDILHRGHVRLLELAAESAEVVIVAVNSDDYVRRSPHKIGGPYVDQVSRATLIASLASVDVVTISDDNSPRKLIERIRPDILVMGKEYERRYRDRKLPGMREIERISAKVVFAEWEDTQGVSSSAIAQRIRSS